MSTDDLKDDDKDKDTNNVYESNASLNMYLGLHYPSSGTTEPRPPILPHEHAPLHGLRFPQRVAELLVRLQPKTLDRALDIGCAVGGSSFCLAKTFGSVDAFDYSASFITAAQRMKANDETVFFEIPVEADLCDRVRAVHEKGITPEITARVNFFVGDACKIPELVEDGQVGGANCYDGVILSNLLCRLPDPFACLEALPPLVKVGGVVVMVTPYSWLEEYTPRDKWMGGFYDNESSGAAVSSQDVLQQTMERLGFEKIHQEQMPLVIREHQRKYQYIISEATGWRKLC
jgi:putative 4-mercaptohistidine N1-methyltranferase